MDAPNLGPGWTVRELVAWWSASGFAQLMSDRSRLRSERRMRQHLASLFDMPCADLDAERLVQHLAQVARAGSGPELCNKIRGDLRRAVRAAKGSRRWPWDDPTELARRFRVPSRAWRTLSMPEARALLWHARMPHVALFATALYTGMRKGELFGLQHADVDLPGRRIYVRRSGWRETTKNGRARVVPVSDELERYLRRQLAWWAGRSAYVFPGVDGGMRHVEGHVGIPLRSALKRAGVEGHVRFQDLRHTSATLLRRAGADRDLVAAILGHVSHAVTERYTHFDFTDLLAAANRLALGAPEPLPKEEA